MDDDNSIEELIQKIDEIRRRGEETKRRVDEFLAPYEKREESINRLLEKYLGNLLDWHGRKKYPSTVKIKRLIAGIEQIQKETWVDYYSSIIISDSYFILGDYKQALNYYPIHGDIQLNLQLLVGENCTARDIIDLFGKFGNTYLTNFGRKNEEAILCTFQSLLDDWELENGSLIKYTIENNLNFPRRLHQLFRGTFWTKDCLYDNYFYLFSQSNELKQFIKNLARQAENNFREMGALPLVGEGWLSETNLYNEIKNSFPDLTVIFHGSPEWLKPQHLDIYIPNLNLALEYQGAQHNKPIDFFGGEEAYQKRILLDRKKLNLCRRHKVRIIYVYEGYDINKVKNEIESR